MAKRTVNNGQKKIFNISNLEGDIRRQKSTAELCEIYGKQPKDIEQLIARSYRGSGGKKVRELSGELAKNDKLYAQRMATNARKEEKLEDQPVVVTTAVSVEKTPQQIQEGIVQEAKLDFDAKTNAANQAEEEYQVAQANKRAASTKVEDAKKALSIAKDELTKAEDAVRMAESKKYSAGEAQEASRKNYEEQKSKLDAMMKPKLLHISAVADGIPAGKVYMSKIDYAMLSEEDKAKVIPVDTAGSSMQAYTEDFYILPTKMSMQEYKSACQYALAYVKLVLEENVGFDLEIVCKNEDVRELAEIQQS